MYDPRKAYVTLAPRRPTSSLFSAPDLRSALERIRAGTFPDAGRLAVWTDLVPPEPGLDVVACVPVSLFEDRRAQAEDVVARWDDVWLLVESMPRGQREVARHHLVDVISVALLAAAIEGVGEREADGEEDVGF